MRLVDVEAVEGARAATANDHDAGASAAGRSATTGPAADADLIATRAAFALHTVAHLGDAVFEFVLADCALCPSHWPREGEGIVFPSAPAEGQPVCRGA